MENKNLSPQKFVPWFMWSMFCIAIFVYGLVIWLSRNSTLHEGVLVPTSVKNSFYVVSFIFAFVSLFVIDNVFKRKINNQKQNGELTESQILTMYFPFFLIKLAVSESIAIFGMTLAFMGEEKLSIFLPFAILSFLLLLINRPKEINN